MDWLPPIEVSRISDGGKVRPQKELFLIQSDSSVRYGSFFLYLSLTGVLSMARPEQPRDRMDFPS